MTAELENGLPANGTNGVNGNATELANSTPAHPAFSSIPDVIQAFANDEFVIVLDSPSRENEGDLIIAASALTPSKASFMIRYSSGYICAPLPVSRAAALHLPQMVADNADPNRTAYAVSIDASDPRAMAASGSAWGILRRPWICANWRASNPSASSAS
ncbi:3,4-dihydroxy-2-butanone 4-phosphate synthase [Stemphylium lycopersici]|nr:3,4-dihydroxy-2-butanone 4-phosphate synthase [Stemphylium lycopersici]